MPKYDCDNQFCESPATKTVHVSVDKPGDQKRHLCVACEEVFTWGVQHGRMVAEQMAEKKLREQERTIQAQARLLRRIARLAQFTEDDGAMDLGERLLNIERLATPKPQKEKVQP